MTFLVACAAGPLKQFKTIQYLPYDGNCFERLMPDGSLDTKCYFDEGTNEEKDWIVIKKSDFNRELDFQALLRKSCRKWKR